MGVYAFTPEKRGRITKGWFSSDRTMEGVKKLPASIDSDTSLMYTGRENI